MKYILAAIWVSLVAAPALACSVDKARYDSLVFDMTLDQVQDWFGCSAGTDVAAQVASGAAVTHDWVDSDTGFTVTTVFLRGELRSMATFD